ncbi:hypothetical protein SAMN05216567_118157 [Variovorax sp. OK605]|uniref:hypothetical protein n=1 Tax=Variovorax sp. OK605 TaxID=1855317 RepID=UPI0008EC90A1|nr:hypothetical protein [Variovorax sp. OK605]SFQ53452.1 hypothetical protein SAMN05216567_118157 [Variovorax sp. OK605]
MSESFLILNRRFGGDIRDPSDRDLEDALRQVFIEDHPQLTEADYEEHRGAFLRFGSDEGPMFVVYVYRRGDVVLEQWADADYEDELVAALHLHRVTFDDALRLWKLARDKNISGLRQEPWVQS